MNELPEAVADGTEGEALEAPEVAVPVLPAMMRMSADISRQFSF
jgi:hypothetical protein